MKTEPATLVIFIPGFPANEDDSVCLPAQQAFIHALNKQFPSVHLVIFSFQYPFHKKEYTWFKNTVIPFGGRNKGGLSRVLLWRKVERTFSELVKKKPVAGILSFWCGECGLTGKRLGKRYQLPHYCWIMGQDAKKENHYVEKMKPVSSSLIAISDFTREEFSKNHHVMPAHVIPLGVAMSPLKNEERNIDILGVGSLIPLKQFDLFINLIAAVKSIYPGINAVICGKGPEEKRLKELVEKNNLQNNIVLEGEKPHSKILELMSRTRILLHPSSFEGFSGVCLEALHAGAHVLSLVKPMKHEISNWHVASSADDMKQKLIELMGSPLNHQPVNAYTTDMAAQWVMKLFFDK
jgi:glycosyltransferase involved in cell wall biosynthesis